MKRSALIRRTPLRKARPTQRRCVAKPKVRKAAAYVRHHAWIRTLPCRACGAWPVEAHHVRHDGLKGISRNHELVIPLCPSCHRTGRNAVHRIGTPKFEALFGFSQIAVACALWAQSNA
jgi:hypothetical protein